MSYKKTRGGGLLRDGISACDFLASCYQDLMGEKTGAGSNMEVR